MAIAMVWMDRLVADQAAVVEAHRLAAERSNGYPMKVTEVRARRVNQPLATGVHSVYELVILMERASQPATAGATAGGNTDGESQDHR